jgi:hypothetical protein
MSYPDQPVNVAAPPGYHPPVPTVRQPRPEGQFMKKVMTGVVVVTILFLGVVGAVAIPYVGTYSVQHPARFAEHERIGRLVHTKDPRLLAVERNKVEDMRDEGHNNAFYAIYEDTARRDGRVTVFGWTERVLRPWSGQDALFRLADGDGPRVVKRREVDGGELGGWAECGTMRRATTDVGVCVWADFGSEGIVVFPKRTIAESVSLLSEIRGASIIRG